MVLPVFKILKINQNIWLISRTVILNSGSFSVRAVLSSLSASTQNPVSSFPLIYKCIPHTRTPTPTVPLVRASVPGHLAPTHIADYNFCGMQLIMKFVYRVGRNLQWSFATFATIRKEVEEEQEWLQLRVANISASIVAIRRQVFF